MSRTAFVEALSRRVLSGEPYHEVLTAPIGAGKSHALRTLGERLREHGAAVFEIDLLVSASTPEELFRALIDAVRRGLPAGEVATFDERLKVDASTGARASESPSGRLLDLFSALTRHPPPGLFLVDEITEIRSLAYFPDLSSVEERFAALLLASRAAIATSSYARLAERVFEKVPGFDASRFTPLGPLAPEDAPTLSSEALELSKGLAAPAFALQSTIAGSGRREGSNPRRPADLLIAALRPGAPLESLCRRHYDILLMRSRGYAVSKIAAAAVAELPGARLTDLVPRIGRSPGACRQYLQWLVEVGLLRQDHKRYVFADPLLGLWAAIYLGSPTYDPDLAAMIIERYVGSHVQTTRAESLRRLDTPARGARVASDGLTAARPRELLDEIL